jgi:acetyl esterase/lipase
MSAPAQGVLNEFITGRRNTWTSGCLKCVCERDQKHVRSELLADKPLWSFPAVFHLRMTFAMHLHLVVLLTAALMNAMAAPLEIKLWPGKPPGNEPELPPELDTTKDSDNKVAGQRLIRLGNISTPTITVYPAPAEKANGTAVMVCPGGGYTILAWDLEGTEVCERLNVMGITGILLKYRVPKRPNQEKHLAPLQDAQRAMGIIRERAAEWRIDPKRIGVLGFSAGGHLAAVLSNQAAERTYPKIDRVDDLPSRPDFSILIYPAYLAVEKEFVQVSPELTITTNSPQAFITITEDDPVHVEGVLTYAAALKREKVPLELHVYPSGGHGYGLRKTANPVTSWPDLLQEWFSARGLIKK